MPNQGPLRLLCRPGWTHSDHSVYAAVPGTVLVRGAADVEQHSQLGARQTFKAVAREVDAREVEARRHRRFKIEVAVRVYPRDCPVVRGDTVDLSESGISAILRIEIPLGEVVRLEFTLPFGDVDLLAMVRQRSAFRYGFQFVEAASAQDIIGRSCQQLAVAQSLAPELGS
jgi:hypothetical protein